MANQEQLAIDLLPQVAEMNTPRLMDAAGECFLYYEFRQNVHLLFYRSIWFRAITK